MTWLGRMLMRPTSRIVGRIILPWLGRKRLRHLRDAVQKNIEVALSAHDCQPRGTPERLAHRAFSNFGAYIADYFLLPWITRRSIHRWVTAHEGTEHLDAAVARGRGVLLMTCHLGLWELGGVYLRYGGYDVNVVGLVDREHAGITEFRDWMRARHGIGVINRDGVHLAALTIRELLAENKIVALLGDRLVGEKGVEVDFMGRRVAFPVGPLRMARATGATVLPCFVIREGRGYRATIEPPVEVGQVGNLSYDDSRAPARERQVANLSYDDLQGPAQELARRFERRICRHLDQWYVFFPFWEPSQGFEL
jgi:KDO2-lipid IV(A) lauroyltransferase